MKDYKERNYFLEIPPSHVKRRLKSAPQKLNFVTAKAVLESYTIDYSRKSPFMFTHSCEK